MNSFKYAAKNKVRFYGVRGALTAEDLWRLNLDDLDDLYIKVNKLLEETSRGSYLNKDQDNEELKVKLDILKEIMDDKIREREEEEQAIENAQKKQRILAVLEQKELGKYEDMDLDELKELAESL